jgi:DNA recombination protein RmuC
MFVPGDGFLVAALDKNPNLIAEAMDQRVLLVPPTSLFALCKAVAYGWRAELQARNTAEILQTGRELHKRLAAMARHIHGMGRMLGATVSKYNEFIGSLESQVLTQARRFEELGIGRPDKPVAELHSIGTPLRELVKLAGDASESPSEVEAGS